MKEWVNIMSKSFSFPHIKMMYPTAPLQPYTPAGRNMSHVWFDRADISPNVPEKEESIAKIEREVKNLIEIENDAGIPTNRIIVGGFSMGGALTFHTAYRWHRNVAGAFVFSSFLNNKSLVYDELKNSPSESLPPLLQVHGDSDEMVPLTWGQQTFEQVQQLGVKGEFHILERLGHSLNKSGIAKIKKFIEKHLPDNV
ncbi:lysophospholipase-like protein 1 isoform X2 [Plodia interpunctella]|nr:lysophospholipase-like protein 1 isoform X2 [Plodia interpunctella]